MKDLTNCRRMIFSGSGCISFSVRVLSHSEEKTTCSCGEKFASSTTTSILMIIDAHFRCNLIRHRKFKYPNTTYKVKKNSL